MKNHQFTFELEGVTADSGLEDKLFEAGCDDALISYEDGNMLLSFDRMAPTLEEAQDIASKQIATVYVTEIFDLSKPFK